MKTDLEVLLLTYTVHFPNLLQATALAGLQNQLKTKLALAIQKLKLHELHATFLPSSNDIAQESDEPRRMRRVKKKRYHVELKVSC